MPKPILTAEMLKQQDYHKHIIQLFQEHYPNGITKWNLEEQIKFLKTPLRNWLSRFWHCGFLKNISMTGADLSRLNLKGADLTGADLTEANLTEANLRYTYFWNADLTKANLTGVDFTRANLLRVNLTYANLTGADLRYCNFTNAIFHKTIITNAKLDPKNFYRDLLKK